MIARLEARARARAQRRLAAHMEPDEQVLTLDGCRGGKTVDELLRRQGPRVRVVLSTKALYVVEGDGSVSRLPITAITNVSFQEPPAPGDVVAAAAHKAAGDRARIVVLEVGERGFVGFLSLGRRSVADFAPKLEQLLRDRRR